MRKFIVIIFTLSCVQLLLSCSSNFNTEDWEGAVFVSSIDPNYSDFVNDSARIELLPDSVCKVKNLSFIAFADSVKWPEQFIGKWHLYEYEYTKSLIIIYGNRQTSFEICPFDIDANLKPYRVTLRHYVVDPDDMIYHVLIKESDR